MNTRDWRTIVLSPRKGEGSKESWGRIPQASWDVLAHTVEHVFKQETVYLFIEALYLAIYNQAKYPKPPKGVLPKHLGISKSYLAQCLKYVLRFSKAFVTHWVAPRPIAEMEKIAEKYYANLGIEAPADRCWRWKAFQGDQASE